MIKQLPERFWAQVTITPSCWPWTGTKTPDGYGRIWVDGREHYVHRLSYEIHNGTIARGLVVDHLCHNPACVNPAHLRAVTIRRNQQNRSGANTNSRSGVRGVFPHKPSGKWQVQVTSGGRRISGGYFTDLEEAGRAAAALRSEVHA